MRLIIILISLSVLSSPICALDLLIPSDRVVNRLNVRVSPTTQSATIAKLGPGQSAQYIESVPSWHQIRLNDGRVGFVSKQYSRVIIGNGGKAQDDLKIHFISIGAGTCTLVECPGENTTPLMIDCGSHWVKDSHQRLTPEEVKNYITPILHKYGNKVNLVTSHADYDHYTYIPTVLKGIDIGQYWMGGLESDYGSLGFPEWLGTLKQTATTIHNGLEANSFTPLDAPINTALSCGDADTYILTNGIGDNKNSKSLVIMLDYKDFSIIFTGDAEGSTENQILNNYDELIKATVLVGSHHGASTHKSNHTKWINTLTPKVSIFSTGWNFKHPKCEVTERYQSHLAPAPNHKTQCNSTETGEKDTTNKAEYVTEAVGTIVLWSDGTSPMGVTCSNDTGCNGFINH